MYREAGLESLEHARSDFTFELSRCYEVNLLLVSVYFFYVHCNLLCHIDVIQQQKHREYTVHGLYCYIVAMS